ncbi:transcription-repair coupling factor [Luteolibacter arcticus]|uniref:Transcription-repair-coupling factor n=1 Tax=Luteolibacter arcticus TaxID=1581411 RepID=A0ABT3GCV0_9BACT|nr:transcription-repair coupling factor [Luteolibacter arcticus]MCW1921379.1 transcription-repair coupling factor [Luteolibacter arcticus]
MPRKADDSTDWLQRAIGQPDFAQRLTLAVSGAGGVVFDHADEAAHSWLAAVVCRHLTGAKKMRLWLVCDAPRQRERLAAELDLWGIDAADLPEMPVELEGGQLADPESAALRLEVLDTAAQRDACVILCGAEAFSQGAPSPAELAGSRLVVKQGAGADPLDLSAKLSAHGYDRVTTVQGRGQFAVRGGILDVFPWQGGRPLRLEFFGDEVDSLREFDVDTQASVGKLAQAELLLAEPELEATVADYVRKGDVRIAFEDADIEADVRILSGASNSVGEEDFSTACFGSPLGSFEAGDFVLEQSRRQSFFDQLDEWRSQGWQMGIVFSNKGEEERFIELAGHESVADVIRLRGELVQGFTVPAARMAVLSSSELFGRYRTPGTLKRSRQETRRILTARASLDDIQESDLVVHYEYGIGRFRGIAPGESGEEITIEYKDGGMLAVPIDQAHLVAKYVGLGGKTPDLNKLGGAAWKNIRKSAEKSILDYAAQLLRIQAERQAEPGIPHPPDSRWMWEFENSFHYTETPDQRRAIEQSKRDMESAKPMDRLICGDVGFGKTEVAIRAAFKAATGGMQVAVLVPTTVLAEQHWRTFRERMSDYPIRVDLLNRFRTPSEIRETIQGLADGSVDIVIGTHRLISGDVHFKNLGLAVVDEEQRFGVKHKEKFKELFRSIDVMTLSATPIPRTLYMALMGARDMSTIDTPPPNRVPVHTSVVQYDERIIRDAILREMKRGGQVFFLHNRVKSIEMMRKKLQELVPEARILVGHGQMEKDELEVVMRNFVHGEADILLATTIIETGIDIPNANTILIDRADRFGLADLYQLRGRVGRAGEKAYAILLLPRDFITAGDARKRIHAIKQYTALGSGFKIAMRDLEIRGAGNLLGTRQSGHIAAVGFDLYCQLLRQSVDRLQGKTPKARVDATFRSDFVAFSETEFARGSGDGPLLPAYLPSGWLDETQLRVSAYRELAESMVENDLDQMEARWRDRFGRLPEPAENLITVGRIRLVAAGKGVASVEIKGQRLMLQRGGDYIMLEGTRFPRLISTGTRDKLHEALEMLRAL